MQTVRYSLDDHNHIGDDDNNKQPVDINCIASKAIKEGRQSPKSRKKKASHFGHFPSSPLLRSKFKLRDKGKHKAGTMEKLEMKGTSSTNATSINDKKKKKTKNKKEKMTKDNTNNNKNNNQHQQTKDKDHEHGFFHAIQKFFSLVPDHGEDTNDSHSHRHRHRHAPKTLLYNCTTPEEHFDKLDKFLTQVKDKHGIEGLLASGFNYITVPCKDDFLNCCTRLYHTESKTFISTTNRNSYIADGEMYEETVRLCQEHAQDLMIKEGDLNWITVCDDETKGNPIRVLVSRVHEENKEGKQARKEGSTNNNDGDIHNGDGDISLAILDEDYNLSYDDEHVLRSKEITNKNSIDSTSTIHVNPSSRDDLLNGNENHPTDDISLSDGEEEEKDINKYIISADDDVSLSDEEEVPNDADIINEARDRNDNKIDINDEERESNMSMNNPTTEKIGKCISYDQSSLLITTGKGKVRAGIFSRKHLLVTSIESSTALPMIRDARQRGVGIIIIDPNARGDRNGMVTYEQSMRVLFGHTNRANEEGEKSIKEAQEAKNLQGSLYILAHSASGSQLSRYLMTEGRHILSRIKAVAFTDSTHSIQWLDKDKENAPISAFFQSPSTLYIRSSNMYRDDDWEKHKPGDDYDADQFWRHRFGNVKTIWAGTTDHSLTNWTSHSHIWDHFDRCHKNV